MKILDVDILVLGGGWSGLVATEELTRRGRSVLLLEKEPHLGGLIRTLACAGLRFDIGGHAFYFKKRENGAYLCGLLDDPQMLKIRRRARIYFQGKYLGYPPGMLSLLRLDKKDIWRIALENVKAGKGGRQDNFEEWARLHYGDRLFHIYFNDYTQKVWGQPCCAISSAWAEKRIGRTHLTQRIRNVLLSRGEGTDAASRHFLYPRRGIGELATAIEHRLAGRCLIGCGARSFRFERKGRRLTSLTYTGDGQPRRVLFKKVLSTIPLQELFSCLPGDVVLPAVDARTIGYRSLIVAALVVDKPRVSAWHWCYFPQKDILFSRLHEPKAWSQDMVSQKGKTLLCAEIFCDHNDFTWHRDDGQIAFHVKEGLLKSGLLQATDVVSDFRVERVAYAYPLHLCGAEGALASLRDFFNFFDNLRLAGRSGTHSYFNMEECLDNVRESLGAW